ncbi:MAG: hypothetical protein LBG05_02230 [Treponema sp.]|nr:hypothetical protein [Treponema sp.]
MKKGAYSFMRRLFPVGILIVSRSSFGFSTAQDLPPPPATIIIDEGSGAAWMFTVDSRLPLYSVILSIVKSLVSLAY